MSEVLRHLKYHSLTLLYELLCGLHACYLILLLLLSLRFVSQHLLLFLHTFHCKLRVNVTELMNLAWIKFSLVFRFHQRFTITNV